MFSSSQAGLLIKMLVEVDLSKPLMRGTKLHFGKDTVWVDFRYEKLPTFGFYCGVVGHQEKSCEKKTVDAQNDGLREGQFGDWLRALKAGEMKKGSGPVKPYGPRVELAHRECTNADLVKK